MIKAVIFDLDNTLTDYFKFKRVSCEEAVDAMIDAGLNIKKEDAMKKIYEIYSKHTMEDSSVFQRFLEDVDGKVDHKILCYGINAYRKARFSSLSTYPRTISTLMRLRENGIKLAIVSDAPKIKAWLRLTSMKLDPLFDVIVTFDDTGEHKPSKKPFMLALKGLNLKPEECIMVGDSIDRDIGGANNVGIRSCLAKYGCVSKEKDNYGKTIDFKNKTWNYDIDKIEDILEIVLKK